MFLLYVTYYVIIIFKICPSNVGEDVALSALLSESTSSRPRVLSILKNAVSFSVVLSLSRSCLLWD